MSMELVQVRLPKSMIKEIKAQLKKGYYASKSDLIRDALRRFLETSFSFEDYDFEKGDTLTKTNFDHKELNYIH